MTTLDEIEMRLSEIDDIYAHSYDQPAIDFMLNTCRKLIAQLKDAEETIDSLWTQSPLTKDLESEDYIGYTCKKYFERKNKVERLENDI